MTLSFDPIMIENLLEMILEHKPALDAVNTYADAGMRAVYGEVPTSMDEIQEELYCQYQVQAWHKLILTIAQGF